MILFAFYAVLVWYLVAKHRRQPWGFVLAVGGAMLAALATWVLGQVIGGGAGDPNRGAGRGGAYQLAPLWILMFAEAVIVGAVGLFIASLPRRPTGIHCGHCWYDTRGLSSTVCPECGREIPGPARRSNPSPTPRSDSAGRQQGVDP